MNPNTGVEDDARDELAGIEYVGISGVSKPCQDAILRFIHYGDRITLARIISSDRDHCILLSINEGDLVAVKSGFASGYGGEGPRTFSYVLVVLKAHGAEIEEHDVPPDFLQRLDKSALTTGDLEGLDGSRPVRPSRWYDYVCETDWELEKKGTLFFDFPLTLPLAVIDVRIIDLALSFWDGPDDRLLKGYRRLEDVVRERSKIDQHGAKLFSQAYHPKDGKLMWNVADEGERVGKMNLFTGAYQAHRNRRAHGELNEKREDVLAEFLLLNHLFRLENESVKRTDCEPTLTAKGIVDS